MTPRGDVHVRCEDVSHVYHGDRGVVPSLAGTSFEVLRGEFVCLVGPSGCGKSTLLRILAGLDTPATGTVTYAGPRGHGGYVVQEHGALPWLSAADNVAFGLMLGNVPPDERRRRAVTWLERVGLGDFADHHPHELSVGMRQRLAIGRAMVMEAPVLLMDEPFGALDAQTRRQMQDELLALWAGDRRTVVFVTHDIDEAVRLGDRVLVMSARPGRMVADLPIAAPRPRDHGEGRQATDGTRDAIWRLLADHGQVSR